MEVLFAERLTEFYGLLARHFQRGEAWEKAADYLIKAGDAANRLYAHAEARVHYSQALEALMQLPDTEENRGRRIDTTASLVSVSWAADAPEHNLARLAEVEALAVQGRSLQVDGMPGVDRLRLAHVHYWMGHSHYMRNEMREAIGYYQQVLAVAQEVGDTELMAMPASVIGRVLVVQGRYAEARHFLVQAAEPLEKAANWTEWMNTIAFLAISMAGLGYYAQGIGEALRALKRAEEMQHQTGIAGGHFLFACVHLLGGDWRQMADEAGTAVRAAKTSGDWAYVYASHGFEALAESRLGNHQAAIERISEAKEVARRLGERQLILAETFAAVEAEVALNAGHVEDAISLAQNAVAVAAPIGSLYALGLAYRIWGVALSRFSMANWGDAEEQMAASLRACEAGHGSLEAARTHLAWARMCLSRNDRSAALQHLEKAAPFQASGILTPDLEITKSMLEQLQ
jgi:tetratricopeptide (TPR) repeat protein